MDIKTIPLEILEQYAEEYMDLVGQLPPDPPELEITEIECWCFEGTAEIPVLKQADTLIPPSRKL